MKLYDSSWAPSPRRVRIFLAEKGIEVERVMVDLRHDEQLAPAYLAINPRGTVPALVLENGQIITESASICRYFEAECPGPPLFGTDSLHMAQIDSWTRRIEADGYAAAVYAFRNSKPQMQGRGQPGLWPPMPIIPELVDRAHIMWGVFTRQVDERLGQSPWIVGDAISFADITALMTVDFAARAGLSVGDDLHHLGRWHQMMSARPSAAA